MNVPSCYLMDMSWSSFVADAVKLYNNYWNLISKGWMVHLVKLRDPGLEKTPGFHYGDCGGIQLVPRLSLTTERNIPLIQLVPTASSTMSFFSPFHLIYLFKPCFKHHSAMQKGRRKDEKWMRIVDGQGRSWNLRRPGKLRASTGRRCATSFSTFPLFQIHRISLIWIETHRWPRPLAQPLFPKKARVRGRRRKGYNWN